MIPIPIFSFKDTTKTGIHLVPLNNRIMIEDSDGAGNPREILLIDKTGITADTTIATLLTLPDQYKEIGGDSLIPYDFTATAGQTNFSVVYTNAETTVVFINGIKATYGVDYTLSGGDTLILTEGATAGTKINASVFFSSQLYIAPQPFATDIVATTASQTLFTANYNIYKVAVFVNGIKLNPNTYTATNGTSITLNAGVDIGTWVHVLSNNLGEVPGTLPWASITGTPTTLAGYGIASIDWASITGTPTTLAGYGITDSLITPSNLLSSILDIDGSGSGIDADLLDGVEGQMYCKRDSANDNGNINNQLGNSIVSYRPASANHPSGASHGTCLSFGQGVSGQPQIFIDDNGRTFIRSNSWDNVWSAWKQVPELKGTSTNYGGAKFSLSGTTLTITTT